MRVEDIADVGQVERECFSTPWPAGAYRRELRNTVGNYYIVVRWRQAEQGAPAAPPPPPPPAPRLVPFWSLFQRQPRVHNPFPIVGFAGMWTSLDEAHITTIGVGASHRGRHVGELLLVTLLEEAMQRNTNWVTLEVRLSNLVAQRLYQKYGFTEYGIRKRYYSDNGEDAKIMWSPALRTDAFREQFAGLKATLADVMAQVLAKPS